MRKHKIFTLFTIILFLSYSCEKDYIQEGEPEINTISETVEINEDDEDYVWSISESAQIVLNENSVTIKDNAPGVTNNSNTITITSEGMYCFSGSLINGQIIVDTEDDGNVKIILNNADITSLTSAPIFVKNAKKVILILADETENYLADGNTYQNQIDNEPNAAIFSKADLAIAGLGSLNVDGNFNDGISSKNGLIVKSGNINVNATDDGIRGKDYLLLHDGNIKINSGGDGLKSDNDKNTLAGFIDVDMAVVNITSKADGISAKTNINISNGEFNITSGGGSNSSVSETLSTKGIKAGESITIENGNIVINSSDDAMHSNSVITINGGNLTMSSNDDGIHADDTITINNSIINIEKSFEGIESANINLSNSDIRLTSSDDGLNATYCMGGEASDNSRLTINSGTIFVNTTGDAVDSNGEIDITGGTVIAYGPSQGPNVGLDCNGECKISGGTVIIAGNNSFMTKGPSSQSTQNNVFIIFDSSIDANSIVHIQNNNGDEVITLAPIKDYASIIVSSPKLVTGSSYTIYTDGSSTGTVTDGLYKGGTYTPGTNYESFTISSTVTTLGSTSGGGIPWL